MGDRIPRSKLDMTGPATYRILVQGGLDRRWSARLGGLEIQVFSSEDDDYITQLTGELLDQAALFGVLNSLYNMRYPLISCVYLEVNDGSINRPGSMSA